MAAVVFETKRSQLQSFSFYSGMHMQLSFGGTCKASGWNADLYSSSAQLAINSAKCSFLSPGQVLTSKKDWTL